MSNSQSRPMYVARERFSRETEAERRRRQPGQSSGLVTDWCANKLHEVVHEGRILDLACGNGRHLPELAGPGIELFAGDFSKPMLEKAMEMDLDAPAVCFEAERLPFETDSFEGVFSARFFHHLPTTEVRSEILGEMFRVSKLAVTITYKSKLSGEHLKHIAKCAVRKVKPQRYFNRLEEFEQIAHAHGWSVTEVFSPGSFLTSNRGL
ncbi:MAG: class I SAM-dependent methyltransferase, partial [Candidatus Omnitrophica bacterium]|nr:class I SAM-dependent methyltransferase [Candidatus Omnitrophota bacterium]